MKITPLKAAMIVTLSTPFIMGWSLFGEANIEVDCSINGYGKGYCSFTNTGDADGKACGQVAIIASSGNKTIIKLHKRVVDILKKDQSISIIDGKLYSKTICSGIVEQQSTKKIDLKINGFDDFCGTSTFCDYKWIQQ